MYTVSKLNIEVQIYTYKPFNTYLNVSLQVRAQFCLGIWSPLMAELVEFI